VHHRLTLPDTDKVLSETAGLIHKRLVVSSLKLCMVFLALRNRNNLLQDSLDQLHVSHHTIRADTSPEDTDDYDYLP
jgi:hypothetical protein